MPEPKLSLENISKDFIVNSDNLEDIDLTKLTIYPIPTTYWSLQQGEA